MSKSTFWGIVVLLLAGVVAFIAFTTNRENRELRRQLNEPVVIKNNDHIIIIDQYIPGDTIYVDASSLGLE